MNYLKLSVLFISCLLVYSSCKDDDDNAIPTFTFNIGTSSYLIKTGVLTDYGVDYSDSVPVRDFDISLMDGTADIDGFPKKDNSLVLFFDINSGDSNKLQEGIYSFTMEKDSLGDYKRTPMSIVDAMIVKDPVFDQFGGLDLFSSTVFQLGDSSSLSLDIKELGTDYEINVTGVIEGESISGKYSGKMDIL